MVTMACYRLWHRGVKTASEPGWPLVGADRLTAQCGPRLCQLSAGGGQTVQPAEQAAGCWETQGGWRLGPGVRVIPSATRAVPWLVQFHVKVSCGQGSIGASCDSPPTGAQHEWSPCMGEMWQAFTRWRTLTRDFYVYSRRQLCASCHWKNSFSHFLEYTHWIFVVLISWFHKQHLFGEEKI